MDIEAGKGRSDAATLAQEYCSDPGQIPEVKSAAVYAGGATAEPSLQRVELSLRPAYGSTTAKLTVPMRVSFFPFSRW